MGTKRTYLAARVCEKWTYPPPDDDTTCDNDSFPPVNVASFLRAREAVARGGPHRSGKRTWRGRKEGSTFGLPELEEGECWESTDSISTVCEDTIMTPPPTIYRRERDDLEETFASGQASLPSYISRRIPSTLTEREFVLEQQDKIFASTWLSDTKVVYGTKCNKLFVLNVLTGKRVEIPSIAHHSHTIPHHSSFSTPSSMYSYNPRMPALADVQPAACGIHSIAINPSRTLLAVGAGKPTEYIQVYHLPTFTPHSVLVGHTDMVFSVAWLDDTTLVSGSRDTTTKLWKVDTAPLSIYDTPTVPTITALDGTLISIIHPLISRKEHTAKVRDLLIDSRRSQAATLGLDGYLKLWSVTPQDLTTVSSIPLYHTSETVCLALDSLHTLYAIGSQSHISLADPRAGSVVHAVESLDEGWGVRSLSINSEVVTVGGGFSRISFYDLRAQRYIFWDSAAAAMPIVPNSPTDNDNNLLSPTTTFSSTSPIPTTPTHRPSTPLRHIPSDWTWQDGDPTPPRPPSSHTSYRPRSLPTTRIPPKIHSTLTTHLRTGTGWLLHDRMYRDHFVGCEVRNAVYSLSYDGSGTRLFAAGGPLQLNLKGCYAAVW
ncbi:DDB1- and CUL4-associated factor 12 [Rhizophlyctis rosea]|nr:DDB1- and CUL4-associated factor 12 [Rhizophlyctis rosea]